MVLADERLQPITSQRVADAPTGNGRFDVVAIAAAFPPTAETLLARIKSVH